MIANYIKIAIRNIMRNKLHSIINIMGLAIGIASAVLLLLMVREMESYDMHHSKHERIYLVQSQLNGAEGDLLYSGTSPAVGPTLKAEYPVIEEFVRNMPVGRTIFMDKKGEAIVENEMCYADPEIFRVFDHEFIYGSPEGALDSPRSIVINRTLSQKYFGGENPVGKILSTNKGDNYKVTGVFEDMPRTTGRYYSALIPMMDYARAIGLEEFNSRKSCNFSSFRFQFFTYILINEKADIKSIRDDYKRFKEKYISECTENGNDDLTLIFEPVGKVVLNSKLSEDLNIPAYYLFVSLIFLSVLVLVIASINYMNLATAKSMGRAVEVGIRKVMGADRQSLIRQFLCESTIITIFALLIALGFVEFILPSFNELFDMNVTFRTLTEPAAIAGILILTLFVGILSGSYPALFLSSFLPVIIFRGGKNSRKGKGKFRKLLLTIQFVLALSIINITLAYQKQVDFWLNKDLGFNKSDILIIQADEPEVKKMIPDFIREISKNSNISYVARSLSAIWGGSWNDRGKVENSKNELKNIGFSYSKIDPDFIDMAEIEILEGSSFNREMGREENEEILVNETFVKFAGWTESPIGKNVQIWGRNYKVTGLMKDFNYASLLTKLRPMVFFLMKKNDTTDSSRVTFIKLRSENANETLKFIEQKWKELIPMYPFEYRFLKDIISGYYTNFRKAVKIFNYSAILCVFISCLGLFSLSSFMAEKRTKEIGIRKVHGASVWNIFVYLSYDFFKLIIISGVIAAIISYFSSIMMLSIFPLTPEINYTGLYLITLCMVFVIAILTVSYQVVKAALTDPVKALRYE